MIRYAIPYMKIEFFEEEEVKTDIARLSNDIIGDGDDDEFNQDDGWETGDL